MAIIQASLHQPTLPVKNGGFVGAKFYCLRALVIIIIIHEYYYGGAVALLLQDHLTMSVTRFAG